MRKALLYIVAITYPRTATGQTPTGDFWTLTLSDVVTIVAVLHAPIIAIQVQWRLQLRRERRDRKVWIFKTLMATRATTLDVHHVQALNMIDVEFDGKNKNEVKIRTAWKIYLDHLNTPMDWTKADDSQKKAWTDKSNDLLASLLHSMGLVLGDDFDVIYLKKHVYLPSGHGEAQLEETLGRKGWLSLLAGHRALKMEVTSFPATLSDEEAEEQARLRKLTIEFLEKKEPWPVKVVDSD